MSRILLFSILIFSGINIIAQKKNQIISLDLYYGYNSYFRNFYYQFNTIKKFEILNPIQHIGIGGNIYRGGTKRTDFLGHYSIYKVIPQTIYLADSIKCKVRGFMFSASYGGAMTNRSRRLSLLLRRI